MNRVRNPKKDEILTGLADRPTYNRKRAARLLDTSVKTLYRWEQLKILVPHRDRMHRAYYTPDQIREFFQNDSLTLPGEPHA